MASQNGKSKFGQESGENKVFKYLSEQSIEIFSIIFTIYNSILSI